MAEQAQSSRDQEGVSFQTSDLEEIVALVTRLFGHHRVSASGGEKLLGSVNAHQCGGVLVGQLGYGAQVKVEVEEQRTAWFVTQPIGPDGAKDGHRFQAGELLMFPPQWRGTLALAPAGQLRNAVISDADLHGALQTLLGSALDRPLVFAPSLAPGSPQAERLGRIVDLMYTASGGSPGFTPLLQQAWQRTFAMELLTLWPHSYSRFLEHGTLLPRALRRACEYVEAHLGEPISVVDVACAASVGVRALELGFAKHFNQSPSRYIRNRRLDAAKEDLSASGGRANVAEVALKWGLSNPGQFSRSYRERFGELPSRTVGKRASTG